MYKRVSTHIRTLPSRDAHLVGGWGDPRKDGPRPLWNAQHRKEKDNLLTCAQNLCPIHSKEAMTHPKLSDLLQVFDRGQSEVSCLFRHPSNQVFHLKARVKQAPLQGFDRGHIQFLVGLQCSTPRPVTDRFILSLTHNTIKKSVQYKSLSTLSDKARNRLKGEF